MSHANNTKERDTLVDLVELGVLHKVIYACSHTPYRLCDCSVKTTSETGHGHRVRRKLRRLGFGAAVGTDPKYEVRRERKRGALDDVDGAYTESLEWNPCRLVHRQLKIAGLPMEHEFEWFSECPQPELKLGQKRKSDMNGRWMPGMHMDWRHGDEDVGATPLEFEASRHDVPATPFQFSASGEDFEGVAAGPFQFPAIGEDINMNPKKRVRCAPELELEA